jgi:uncharacterized protein with PIN domain
MEADPSQDLLVYVEYKQVPACHIILPFITHHIARRPLKLLWCGGVVDKNGKPSIAVGFKGEKREFVSRILICRQCNNFIWYGRHPKKLAL